MVVTAILVDEAAGAQAASASAGTERLWAEACRFGLEHPALARAARTCFEAALDAGPRMGADQESLEVTAAFADRFVARSRSPADEFLEDWERRST